MKALRIAEGISAFILTSVSSAALAKTDIDAAIKAARACHANSGNVVLTTNNAIDERPYWLAVLRDSEDARSLACLDDWSVEHLKTHVQIVSVLPRRMPTKTEIESSAAAAADRLSAANNKDGRLN